MARHAAPLPPFLPRTTPRPQSSRRVPSRGVVLFCGWLLLVTGGPGLLCVWAALTGRAGWIAWLPLPGLWLALVSVVLVERPRSLSPAAYLLQLRARGYATSSLSTPDAARPSPQESTR